MENSNNSCKNNFTSKEEYLRNLTPDKINKCEECPHFTYRDGVMTCSKFN